VALGVELGRRAGIELRQAAVVDPHVPRAGRDLAGRGAHLVRQ
jgi:hypothetical protein